MMEELLFYCLALLLLPSCGHLILLEAQTHLSICSNDPLSSCLRGGSTPGNLWSPAEKGSNTLRCGSIGNTWEAKQRLNVERIDSEGVWIRIRGEVVESLGGGFLTFALVYGPNPRFLTSLKPVFKQLQVAPTNQPGSDDSVPFDSKIEVPDENNFAFLYDLFLPNPGSEDFSALQNTEFDSLAGLWLPATIEAKYTSLEGEEFYPSINTFYQCVDVLVEGPSAGLPDSLAPTPAPTRNFTAGSLASFAQQQGLQSLGAGQGGALSMAARAKAGEVMLMAIGVAIVLLVLLVIVAFGCVVRLRARLGKLEAVQLSEEGAVVVQNQRQRRGHPPRQLPPLPIAEQQQQQQQQQQDEYGGQAIEMGLDDYMYDGRHRPLPAAPIHVRTPAPPSQGGAAPLTTSDPLSLQQEAMQHKLDVAIGPPGTVFTSPNTTTKSPRLAALLQAPLSAVEITSLALHELAKPDGEDIQRLPTKPYYSNSYANKATLTDVSSSGTQQLTVKSAGIGSVGGGASAFFALGIDQYGAKVVESGGVRGGKGDDSFVYGGHKASHVGKHPLNKPVSSSVQAASTRPKGLQRHLHPNLQDIGRRKQSRAARASRRLPFGANCMSPSKTAAHVWLRTPSSLGNQADMDSDSSGSADGHTVQQQQQRQQRQQRQLPQPPPLLSATTSTRRAAARKRAVAHAPPPWQQRRKVPPAEGSSSNSSSSGGVKLPMPLLHSLSRENANSPSPEGDDEATLSSGFGGSSSG